VTWHDVRPFVLLCSRVNTNTIACKPPKVVVDRQGKRCGGLPWQLRSPQVQSELGRFTRVDPLWEDEKLRALSPFTYSENNPITKKDPTGEIAIDAFQQSAAVEKAQQYVGSGSRYIMGQKGDPGEPVDCSGLVSRCVVAGGESDPNHGQMSSGVLNIESNTTRQSIQDAQASNIVTFRNEKPGAYQYHTGIITAVNHNANGKVESYQVVHSSSCAKGPTISIIKPNSPNALGPRIRVEAVLKWDKKPDAPAKNDAAGATGDTSGTVDDKRKDNIKNKKDPR
jgi:hypothetical protein